MFRKRIVQTACLSGLLLFVLSWGMNGANSGTIQNIPSSQNTSIQNFTEAKRLARQIYSDHRVTFYCGCKYDKHNKVDLESCGYKIQRAKRRARRLEWEHIVPASVLGASRPCWQQPLCRDAKGRGYKGRRCCAEIDPEFARMEADLHNLVPEIGELNALRSNYRFGVLPHIGLGQFGTCEMKIDSSIRRVEPPVATRGTIARAYLYMSDAYTIHLSEAQRQLFEAWNRSYPPESWEKTWNARVAQVQGNPNPYISNCPKKD